MVSKQIAEPAFVSQEVTDARRYYLNLKPPQKASFVVVCGGVERMQPDYVVSRRDFPYFAVELVAEGEGDLVLNGQRFHLSPGSVFAYGPGVPHTIRNHPQHRMRKYYLDFTGLESKKLLKLAGLAQWKVLHISNVHELIDLFEWIGREACDDSELASGTCETLARLLLLKIRRRAIHGGRKLPRAFLSYEQVRRHIELHFLRLNTVQDIAEECHLTPIYVSRLFRRFGGTGAYHCLLRLKMNHAAELMLEEGLLVKQTAARLGFADAFQFSRAFKRVLGISPTQLLNSRVQYRE